MSCEICGRGSCSKSFHSLDEQQEFDSAVDPVKERIEAQITAQVNRLVCEEIDGDYYVKISDVEDIVGSACF